MAISSRDLSNNDLRALQAASSDKYCATEPQYSEFRNRIHNLEISATGCARVYIERTVTLAADPGAKRELDHFV